MAEPLGGSWIVKLSSRENGSVPENRFSMIRLASFIGKNVPAIDLVGTEAVESLPEGSCLSALIV